MLYENSHNLYLNSTNSILPIPRPFTRPLVPNKLPYINQTTTNLTFPSHLKVLVGQTRTKPAQAQIPTPAFPLAPERTGHYTLNPTPLYLVAPPVWSEAGGFGLVDGWRAEVVLRCVRAGLRMLLGRVAFPLGCVRSLFVLVCRLQFTVRATLLLFGVRYQRVIRVQFFQHADLIARSYRDGWE